MRGKHVTGLGPVKQTARRALQHRHTLELPRYEKLCHPWKIRGRIKNRVYFCSWTFLLKSHLSFSRPTEHYGGADGVKGSQEEWKASNNEQWLQPAEKRWSLWAPKTVMSWATSVLQYNLIIKQTIKTSKPRSESTSEPSTLLVHQQLPRPGSLAPCCVPRHYSMGTDALGMLQPTPPTPIPALALLGTARI